MEKKETDGEVQKTEGVTSTINTETDVGRQTELWRGSGEEGIDRKVIEEPMTQTDHNRFISTKLSCLSLQYSDSSYQPAHPLLKTNRHVPTSLHPSLPLCVTLVLSP